MKMDINAITAEMILADLSNGLTRLKKDDRGYGSIEEKYELTARDVYFLFKTPELKGRRTKIPSEFSTTGLTVREVVNNALKYFQFNKNGKDLSTR
jgi:hypothetical protein